MTRRAVLERLLPAVIVVVIAAVIAAFAVMSVGYPVRKLDLNDSGIWVTNDAEALYGRLNKSAGGLDGLLSPAGGLAPAALKLDMLQDGFHLVARDLSSGRLSPVDPATVTHGADRAVTIDPAFAVDMRGGTLAVLDPKTGRLWAARYDDTVASVDLADVDGTSEPKANVGEPAPGASADQAAALSVGVDGSVTAVSTGGKRVRLAARGQGFAEPTYGTGEKLRSVQVAAVGDRSAVLDAVAGTLWDLAGRATDIGADAQARLQTAAPASEVVHVATTKALLAVGPAGTLTLGTGNGGVPAVPTVLGPCTFAAWAGQPGRILRSCEEAPATVEPVEPTKVLTSPVFRVNHRQIVLNDTADGAVYSFEDARFVDDWEDTRPPASTQSGRKRENPEPDPTRAPKANPDTQGVRPGRTTVIHPLDNDSDPSGRILAIVGLTQPGGDARAAVSPDGQTVLYTLPEGSAGGSFEYTVGNGVATAKATVTIQTRRAEDNAPPRPRAGATVPQYPSSSWGTLTIPVDGDWRDDDGDPISVQSAEVDGSQVGIGADGRLNFVAGRAEETKIETIKYAVSDGLSAPQQGRVDVKVLAFNATAGEAPLTQPDAVRGEVGKPVVIEPLRNDAPGADPLNPRADLTLAGKVAAPDGLQVSTDLKTGQVIVTASEARTFFLDYNAKFGAAKFAPGKIRVDILPPSSDAAPVAVPDQVTVRGQNAGMVDVLANDSDPMGSVLTLQSAQSEGGADAGLQVAVVKGRWVRVMPTTDALTPNPKVVTYTVSNGVSPAVRGTLLVTQLPAPPHDDVMVRDDQSVVRAGDATLIPVLSNDSSASGAPLTIDTNTADVTVGQVKVIDPEAAAGETPGDIGRAYVVNDQVRYVAPASAATQRQFKIQYQASVAGGPSQTGLVTVTVNPAPSEERPNQAPAPTSIEARAVSGQTVEIPVVTSGQDPDGDTVTVLGIASAPKQGRILGFSPRSITYQAFPDEGVGGTDTFTFVVTDRWGATETGLARVAITPPGEVQPPVAVPDSLTARPGADVQVSPMTNDLYHEADRPTIVPFARAGTAVPEGVALGGERGPVLAKAPAKDSPPVQIAYALENSGGVGPAAAITISSREGFLNPPRVYDQVAVADGQRATANVLESAWDPDGPASALRVTHVSDPNAVVGGGIVSLPLLDRIQVVSYEVTDADGATSAGVVYVPAAGTGVPYVKADGLIRVDANTSVTVNLNDYVLSARKTQVRISVAESMGAAPAHLTVTPDSAERFTVTARDDYVGPGAVFMEVMDGDASDPATRKAFVSIPVQVGPETPVLRCPPSTQRVVQGGQPVRLKVSAICNVWTPNPDAAATLAYTAQWSGPGPKDVGVAAGDGFVTLTAGSEAVPQQTGTVRIGVANSPAIPREIQVLVVAAPRPRLVVSDINDVKQGTSVSQTIQMSSPLRQPTFTIMEMTAVGGAPATVEFSGPRFTITPAGTSSGTMTFQVTASDLADRSRTDRFVTARLTVTVYGIPDKPSPPQPAQQLQSHAASVSYAAPNSNGAPILGYEVRGGGVTKACGTATRCDIAGLKNGVPVQFQVRANNKAGWSDWSDPGPSVIPNQAPGRVPSFSAGSPADGALTLTWTPAPVDGTPVTAYVISYAGNQVTAAGGATSTVVRGLDNNSVYTFSIVARNDAGLSQQSASTTGQSSGRPVIAGAPKVTASDLGATAQVTVSWGAADPQGPKPVTYTVTRNGSQVYTGTNTSTSASVTYDGTPYTYAVTATNATGGAEHTSAAVSATWTATGKPASWTSWTAEPMAKDGLIRISYTVPPSRGKTSTVTLSGAGATRTLASGSPTQATSFADVEIGGLTNGTTYSMTLRVCNENNACSQSGAVSATPYGMLRDLALNLSLSGTTVSYNATGSANGKTATLAVTGDFTGSDSGILGLSLSGSRDFGYGRTVSVTATLSDGVRGTQTVTKSIRTPDKPSPSVSISKGALQQAPRCVAAWCSYVVVTTRNFDAPVSCRITSSDQGVFGSPTTLGPNETKQTGWIFGGFVISVTCSNGSESVTGTQTNYKAS